MGKRKIRVVLGGVVLITGLIFALNFRGEPEYNIASTVLEPPPRRDPNPHFLSLIAEYENHILKSLAKTRTPGIAIAIVQDTTVLYIRGIGLRQVGHEDSINIHTVFRLASVSKCFAPVLTGLLVDDGVLSWDDPIIRYLPDFALKNKAYTDSLTIRHVLSHTTGLPYHTYTNLIEEGTDLKTMLNLLRDVTPASKPGELYSYQNVAYSLIAEVVLAATGKTYQQLMHERIFKPLGMEDASMTYEDILLNKNVARPHHLWRKGWRVTSINDTYYNVGPAGGVNASISDMAQWLKTLLAEQDEFIEEETLGEIFTPFVKARSRNRNFRKWIERADSHYALGWRVLNFKTDTLLYHGGYVNGYRSEIAINRKDRIGICVLSNGPGSLVDNSVPYFFHLYFDKRDSIQNWDNNHQILAKETQMMKR